MHCRHDSFLNIFSESFSRTGLKRKLSLCNTYKICSCPNNFLGKAGSSPRNMWKFQSQTWVFCFSHLFTNVNLTSKYGYSFLLVVRIRKYGISKCFFYCVSCPNPPHQHFSTFFFNYIVIFKNFFTYLATLFYLPNIKLYYSRQLYFTQQSSTTGAIKAGT